MVFKKFKEDIVVPYPKSKIVITFYWTRLLRLMDIMVCDRGTNLLHVLLVLLL